MTVEFRLLGDIEAWVDGRRLEIGHARQRCILAAFLIEVNRPVTAEQLVDRVWSDRPPHHGRNSVAGYVSRLRNLFAETSEVSISREPAGYVFKADPLAVDLHRFRSVLTRARSTSDPVEAAELFERALKTWAGEPFAAIDTPWVNDIRTALQAERFSAELDRNDAALRVGKHAELLHEISAAQLSHPLDERLAGQLMLALYRNGRQADALEAFRVIRERLVEELGVDPGAALRQVYQQILTGEAEEATAVERRAGPSSADTVGSAQIPTAPVHSEAFGRPHPALLRRPTSFIGHARELMLVDEALGAGPLVTLTGVGGVGKTRLAFEVARRERDRFGDGVWICEFAPLDHADAVVHTVAASVWLRQQPGMGIDESVIEYLREREVLLVFDNCEHVIEAAAALVQQIVNNCQRVSVLATSRQPLGVEGERIVDVRPLQLDDAMVLFAERAKASQPDFAVDDDSMSTVAEICRKVDCLPLGVELAAARMRVMSTRDVARRLDNLGFARNGTRGAQPRQQSLGETIEWSYRLLTDAEQLFFDQLSVFAGKFDLEAAHEVCGGAEPREEDTLTLLTGLVDKSMVTAQTSDDYTRYSLLEMLRAYGRDRLAQRGLVQQVALRHASYFVMLAERAGAGVQGAGEREWVERMLPQYDNLRAAFEHAMDQHDTDLALRLVAAVPELIGWRVGYEVAEWAERAMAVADPQHPLYVSAVGVAARVAWNHAEFARARSLVGLANGQIPPAGSARVVYPADVIADVALFEGEAMKALKYWELEVVRARRESDMVRLAWTLFVVAICQGVMRNDDVALPAAQEGVAVADATENPTAQAMALLALGYLFRKSEPERALSLFDDSARLAAEVHNFWVYGSALMEAAATRSSYGDPAVAAQLFSAILEHWDRFGDTTQQWLTLRYVARLLIRLGSYDDAAFFHWAFLNAGKPSPFTAGQMHELLDHLGSARLDALRTPPLMHAAVMARARSSLRDSQDRRTLEAI